MPEVNALDNPSAVTDDSDAKQSAFQPVLMSRQTTELCASPSGGPHWTKSCLSHANQPGKRAIAALTMLKDYYYRMRQDPFIAGRARILQHGERSLSFNQMNCATIHLSPSVTYISSSGMYIFGVRFGFTTKNPVEWKKHTAKHKRSDGVRG